MNATDGWDEDGELNEIVSPLGDNVRLERMIAFFEVRWEALRSARFEDAEVHERHHAEVGRLADYLMMRDYYGGFDMWDWEVQFLSNQRFKNLYSDDRHWQFDDFIVDDVEEFLADPNWEQRARTQMTIRECENFLVVLSHLQQSGWGSQMLRLQRILTNRSCPDLSENAR